MQSLLLLSLFALLLSSSTTKALPADADGYVATAAPFVNATGEPGDLVCGVFASASKNDVVNMLRSFRKRFPQDSDATCGAPAKTCTRQYCHNTSGLYICNDNDSPISISCYEVTVFLTNVTNKCCSTSVLQSKGISGQLFSSNGWNAIVAYANCRHDPNADRPSNFAVWGPNGECVDLPWHKE